MRKAAIGIGILCASVATVGTALGGDPKPVSPLAPKQAAASMAPAVKIVNFRRVGGGGPLPTPYTGGALDVLVDVENLSDKPAEQVLVKLAFGPGVLEQTVTVPAKKTVSFKFTDPVGLVSSCSPRLYDVSLSGTGVETAVRKARVTPTCMFSSKVQDPWNLAVPDRVEEMEKNHVYVRNVALEAPPTCSSGPKLKGSIYNHSTLSTASVLVQAKAGNQVTTQTSAAFPLAKGESKNIELTSVNGVSDVPEKLDVTIVDWTHALGAAVTNQGITVTTTRSCMLAFALE